MVQKKQAGELLRQFSDYITNGKAMFLVGAGISFPHPSHLPLAGQIRKEFLQSLFRYSKVISTNTLPIAKGKLSEDRFPDLFLEPPIHEVRFEALMQIIFEYMRTLGLVQIFNSKRSNSNHRFLAEAIKRNNQVVTTNFDRLIENAFGDGLVVASNEDDFKKAKKRIGKDKLLFKIHGTIENEDSIKATLTQIGKSGLGFMWEAEKGNTLEALVRKYHLIVFGYSGMDDFDVMSRLLIIESAGKDVLWVHHNPIETGIVNDPKRIFKDNTLRSFIKSRGASIIEGDTSCIISQLAQIAFDLRLPIPLQRCKCQYQAKYRSLIDKMVAKWAKHEPGLPDFLIARLLYMAGWRRASRKVFVFLENEFRKSQDSLNYARALTNIATIDEDFGKIKSALSHQELANLILSARGDTLTLCDSLSNLGVLHMREYNYTDAELAFRKAINSSKRDKAWPQYAKAASNLAGLLWTRAKYNEAEKWCKRAYKKYKSVGDHSGCATTFATLAKILYIRDNDSETPEILFRMALEHAVRLRDRDMEAKLWNNLGSIYRKEGKLEAATKAYKKAESNAKKVGNRQSVVLSQMGMVSIFLSRGDREMAIELGEKCIAKGRKINLLEHTAQTCGNIGLVFLDQKRFDKALEYFLTAKQDFESLGFPYEMAFTYQNIGECFAGLWRKKDARSSFNRALELYEEHGLGKQADKVRALIEAL